MKRDDSIILKMSTEQYVTSVSNQKESFKRLADRLEQGEEINDFERHIVAGILRDLASKASENPVHEGRGRPSEICEGSVFLNYWLYYSAGDTQGKHTKTCEKIAKEIGVTKQAIFRAIKDNQSTFENAKIFVDGAKIGR